MGCPFQRVTQPLKFCVFKIIFFSDLKYISKSLNQNMPKVNFMKISNEVFENIQRVAKDVESQLDIPSSKESRELQLSLNKIKEVRFINL